MSIHVKSRIIEILSRVKDGFLAGDLHMSFKSVFQDVRGSVDYVHMEVVRVEGGEDFIVICFQGSLKQRTCDDLAKYVKRDERLPQVWLPSLKQIIVYRPFLGVVQPAEVWRKDFPADH